ncbi:hypothetical protein Y1Q_0004139 [Alligator mississippiensis]|uniref:Uncharacterized protein n=1 Tax=Alligator mississippiensis TaxID=8496 RepID=A0A151PIH5_ALLMI|nr:hypothetical protein Y1Q_0004139 [Alligator mississippiensis]
MDGISVVKRDSRTPKTDLGTVADPQQTASEPQAESLGVADKLNPKGSTEVDDVLMGDFQNLCVGGPVRIKVLCVNWFCLCLKERGSRQD